jgi:Flp pilus assembly pilin Flp
MHAVRTSALRVLAGLADCLNDRGVTSSEYALVATLIAVVISGAVALFGQAVNNMFVQIAGAF